MSAILLTIAIIIAIVKIVNIFPIKKDNIFFNRVFFKTLIWLRAKRASSLLRIITFKPLSVVHLNSNLIFPFSIGLKKIILKDPSILLSLSKVGLVVLIDLTFLLLFKNFNSFLKIFSSFPKCYCFSSSIEKFFEQDIILKSSLSIFEGNISFIFIGIDDIFSMVTSTSTFSPT